MNPRLVQQVYDEVASSYVDTFIISRSDYWSEIMKRGIDVVGALLGLFLSSPLILLSTILIKIESPGPVIYCQERVGRYGKPLLAFKLRTMIENADEVGPYFTEQEDPRVTRIGRLLRKTRVDEIPQFLNVLKGEMSLVGPRPHVPQEVMDTNLEVPGYILRHQVKPGITGWAQVNGGTDISNREKFQLDMEYIRNRSILYDLKILVKTVSVVLTGNGAR